MMLASVLLVLAGADDPALLLKSASDRLAVSSTAPVPADGARYRVEGSASRDAGSKTRALGEDGSRCSVTGARLCTRKPHTWLTTDFTS